MKPGFYDKVPMSDYLADPCEEPSASSGLLHTLYTRSPLHAKMIHPRMGGKRLFDDTEETDTGSAAHMLALEPHDAKIAWIDAKDWRTKNAKDERDEARKAGYTPILLKKRDRIERVAVVIREALDTLGEGSTEVTAIWNEPGKYADDETLPARARYDWMRKDRRLLVDVKTTASASPMTFQRTIWGLGYDIQADHYVTGAANLEQVEKDDISWRWLVVETDAPFSFFWAGMDPQAREVAARRRRAAMGLWRSCLENGKFPGYQSDVHLMEAPMWVGLEVGDKEAFPRKDIG